MLKIHLSDIRLLGDAARLARQLSIRKWLGLLLEAEYVGAPHQIR